PELFQEIIKQAQNYDEVILTYMERGTQIVITANAKGVQSKTSDVTTPILDTPKTAHIGNRAYLIKVGQADALLKEIGILSQDGKIKNDMIRKYNQIDHFVELIDKLLKELPQGDLVTVLDCGCGKSYLSFVLNFYLKNILKRPCQFIGLDYSETVIEASRKMAKNLAYHNMTFIQTDILAYTPDRPIDLVISLHACDTATDMALGLGIRTHAKAMVSVPCCQKELLGQIKYEPFAPIFKHGILKARMADALTDGLRALKLEACGYEVSVLEYISPLETPKNLMLRAVKTKAQNIAATAEYNTLKKLLGVSPAIDYYSEQIGEM
ncbi:MAG: SAM-dependent methyltransferase, partial [Hyphomonadaceae bacterium]|nr:SAM-dependent methyltransferase [Clostridia bacterium]